MQDLQSLETSVLIDMLAQHTKEYTAMLFADRREGIVAQETIIFQIQDEINARRIKAENTSITDTNINFEGGETV